MTQAKVLVSLISSVLPIDDFPRTTNRQDPMVSLLCFKSPSRNLSSSICGFFHDSFHSTDGMMSIPPFGCGLELEAGLETELRGLEDPRSGTDRNPAPRGCMGRCFRAVWRRWMRLGDMGQVLLTLWDCFPIIFFGFPGIILGSTSVRCIQR